jgi:hypothetical protein
MELWKVAPDGTRQRALSFLTTGEDVFHPAWGDPFGLIAVVENNRDPANIVFYDFSDVVGYTSFPLRLRNLDVAADGRVAFDAEGDIWITDLDDLYISNNITNSPDVVEANPSWSPEGNRIAFEAAGWIVTTAADGGDLHRVVEGEDPAWSPRLAATAVRPAHWGRVKREIVNPR